MPDRGRRKPGSRGDPGTLGASKAKGRSDGAITVSKPGDRLEREADRQGLALARGESVAASASAGPGFPLRRMGAGETASRAGESPSASGLSRDLQGGEPLEARTRAYFEPRLDRDLSQVRIHRDAAAQHASQALQAEAFTYGPHIAFARGAYRPESFAGRRLLGHELAHVSQQGDGEAAGVQRKEDGRGGSPLLIDIARIDPVWSGYVLQEARRLKLSVDDPKVRESAERLTERQVGALNYARWKAPSHPDSITLEPATQKRAETEIDAQLAKEKRAKEAERAKKTRPLSSAGTAAELRAEADAMFDRTRGMRDDVVAMERAALKLKTPDGLEGKVYQYGAGTTSMIIGPTLGTAGKLMSLPVQKIIAKVRGVRDGHSGGQIAEDAVSDVVTGFELTTGELDQIYADSRANYERYLKAYDDFTNARIALKKAGTYMDAAPEFGKARTAKQEMSEAYLAYMTECEMLGIPVKARHLETAIEDLKEGTLFAMETAASLPFGGGGVSKEFRAILREGEQAVAESALAGGKEILKDTGKEALRDSTKVGKEAVKDSGTIGKEAVKEGGKGVEASEDMLKKLSQEAANDTHLPGDAGVGVALEEQSIKQAVGDSLVHGGKPGASDAIDPILNAAGGSGTRGLVSAAPASKNAFLNALKRAKGVGFHLRSVPVTKEYRKAGMKYWTELAATGSPQKAGTAAHDTLKFAPRGADAASKDMIGEFKTVAEVVTQEIMENAMAQGEKYAKDLGKQGVVVRVFEMSTGNLYEVTRM